MNSFSSPSKIDREKIIEILGRIYTFSINPSLRREQWNEYFLDFIRTLHQECRSQGVDVEEKTHITYYSNILKQAIRPQYLYRYRNVNNFSFDELNKEYTWLAKPSTLNDKLEGKGVCYTIPPETMPAFIPREWRNKSIPIDTFGISCFSEAKNGNDDDPILVNPQNIVQF